MLNESLMKRKKKKQEECFNIRLLGLVQVLGRESLHSEATERKLYSKNESWQAKPGAGQYKIVPILVSCIFLLLPLV